MNRHHRPQHNIPHGLLYSIAPQHIAQLHLADDILGDEFDWEESSGQYESESTTCGMLGVSNDFGDD